MKPSVMTQPAGKRNAKVIVEQNVTETNSDGQKVPLWRQRFQLHAEVVPRAGREARRFEQLRAEVDFIVRVEWGRNSRQIKPADWRLVYDGRELNIAAVFTIGERRRLIEMHCTEIVV